jgi:hypothetical protein
MIIITQHGRDNQAVKAHTKRAPSFRISYQNYDIIEDIIG